MKRGILVVTLLALASCESGTGVAEPASLTQDSEGTFTGCFGVNNINCDFVGDGRNVGLGCATDVRGVVKFLDAAGVQLGPSKSWSLPGFQRVVRPDEAFTFTVFLIPESIVNATETKLQEFSWTDIEC